MKRWINHFAPTRYLKVLGSCTICLMIATAIPTIKQLVG